MLFCCLRRRTLWLLVMNTSSSSAVKNKRRRLPASSVIDLPRSGVAVCIALGIRTVHSTRWSEILAENCDVCLPHLHSTPPLGEFPSEYCHNVWYGKTRMVWLPELKKSLRIRLFVSTESTNVTDRQTDTAWRHRPRLCITSSGNKSMMSSVLFVDHPAWTRRDSLPTTVTKNGDERLSKLSTHRAEQKKVNGAVDQSQNVEEY